MSSPHGRKIAIIGGSGQVGKPTIDGLVKKGVHTITAIQRPEATSEFPNQVIVKTGDLEDRSFLARVFDGQDVVILMPPLSRLAQIQEPAVHAAGGLWGIDAKARKATLWHGANVKASTAGIRHTGQAVAAAAGLPERELAKFKNKALYTPSFLLTQREILDAVQSVTETTDKDWNIQWRDVDQVAREYEEKIRQGDGMAPYVKFFVTHFLEGHGADFSSKVETDVLEQLEHLGLEKETLEQVIKSSL